MRSGSAAFHDPRMRRECGWVTFLLCLAVTACSVPTLTVVDASDSGRDGASADAYDAQALDVAIDVPPADVVTDNGCPDSACGCADLQHDPMHCGACGTACSTPANTTPICNNGVCDTRCATTFADCDRNAGNGCEVNLATSNTDCGTCGRVCSGTGAANTVPACMAGVCGFACLPGFADCDGTASNGCEVSLNSPTNCHGCGNICRMPANAIPTCGDAGCGLVCLSHFGDCDGVALSGCEVDLFVDHANCGACHRACVFSDVCCNGNCQPPFVPCSPL